MKLSLAVYFSQKVPDGM